MADFYRERDRMVKVHLARRGGRRPKRRPRDIRRRRQLKVGGRLVIPVGESQRSQRLLAQTRSSETEYREEDLGDVHFVPLLGEHGWSADPARPEHAARAGRSKTAAARSRPLSQLIREAAEPLPDIDDPAFGQLFCQMSTRFRCITPAQSIATRSFPHLTLSRSLWPTPPTRRDPSRDGDC
jgi:hypothetical protein